jgi:hypothetical protein
MKRLLVLLALAALLPAPAQARAPWALADSSADTLVALVADDASVTQVGGKAFDTGFAREIATDPRIKAAFDADPVLRDRVAAALRGDFLASMRKALPALRDQLSGIVAQDMTPTEIIDTIAFFQSSVGKKLRTLVYRSLGNDPSQTQAQVTQQAMTSLLADLKPEEYPALLAFGGSPAAQKLQAVNPKIQAASQAWGARLFTDNAPRLRVAARKAVASAPTARP